MTATRFVAAKFKDKYTGDDEESKQIREKFLQKHVALYKSRSYVSDVQGEWSWYPIRSIWNRLTRFLHDSRKWWPTTRKTGIPREYRLTVVIGFTELTLQSCSMQSLRCLRCVFEYWRSFSTYFELQSEEKVAYYADVDPEHLDFKAGPFFFSSAVVDDICFLQTEAKPYLEAIFAWGFPPRDWEEVIYTLSKIVLHAWPNLQISDASQSSICLHSKLSSFPTHQNWHKASKQNT